MSIYLCQQKINEETIHVKKSDIEWIDKNSFKKGREGYEALIKAKNWSDAYTIFVNKLRIYKDRYDI